MNYDKPRIASTVIIGIILLVAYVVSIYTFVISSSITQEIISKNNNPGAVVAIIAVLPFHIIVGGIVLVATGFTLGFSIPNRKSTLKTIRILSYVELGLSIFLIVAWIVISVVLFVLLAK